MLGGAAMRDGMDGMIMSNTQREMPRNSLTFDFFEVRVTLCPTSAIPWCPTLPEAPQTRMDQTAKHYIASLHNQSTGTDLEDTWYCIAVCSQATHSLCFRMLTLVYRLVHSQPATRAAMSLMSSRKQSAHARKTTSTTGMF